MGITEWLMRLKVVPRVFLFLIFLVAIPPVQAADVTYEYDERGRLVKVTYDATGKTIEYTYDEANNRTTVVISTNQPPVAVNDSSTTFGTSKRMYVLTNDSDPDSDPLTITSTSVINGTGTSTIACSSTCIDMTTSDFVTANYTISDGQGHSDTATVTLIHLDNF